MSNRAGQCRFGFVETLVGGGIVAFAILAAWRLLLFNPRVNQDNFERISLGMTQDEVERVLGQGRWERRCCLPSPPSMYWRYSSLTRLRIIRVTFAGPQRTVSYAHYEDESTHTRSEIGAGGFSTSLNCLDDDDDL